MPTTSSPSGGRSSMDRNSERVDRREEEESQEQEERDTLLTGRQKAGGNIRDTERRTWLSYRELGIFVWAAVATTLVVILAVLYQHAGKGGGGHTRLGKGAEGGKISGKRNLIFMVSDGMGPTSLSLTRSYRQTAKGLPYNDKLVLDEHLIGSSRTRSTSSLITDSAAGATAFSCGIKSYNGAISILPDHSPCGTVMEAAKEAGYTTGLVVTTRLTDATPACFAAHADHRQQEDSIAEQMIGEKHPLGRVVDLMMGGGRCHFLPNTTEGSCRDDGKDLVDIATTKHDWKYISTRSEFDGLKAGHSVKLPILGLFAETDIPYEIDRRKQSDQYPSLSEMARTALNALAAATQDSEQGFFVMIEGSRIDHAGHGNDPVAQVHEVLEYDATFAAVLDFLESSSTPGVLVSTSDHETGGLATARQLHEEYPEYLWLPDVLANASASAEFLGHELMMHVNADGSQNSLKTTSYGPVSSTTTNSSLSENSAMNSTRLNISAVSVNASKTFIRENLVRDGLGIIDATDAEIDRLYNSSFKRWPPSAYTFADMVSRRAQVGWTSHGHSAVDVNIYASDPDLARHLSGNHENTDVGKFMQDFLDVDVADISARLKKAHEMPGMESWTGENLKTLIDYDNYDEDIDNQRTHLDRYHGDFRRRRKRNPRANVACDCGKEH